MDPAGLDQERRALEAMACGLPLGDVLLRVTALVEGQTGGTCRIVLGAAAAGDATIGTCSAVVSLAGEPAGRVGVELAGPADELVDAVVRRAAALTGMAVSAARRAEQQAHGATHDPLTGLPNRTLLLDRLGHAVAAGRRRGGRVALLYLDLDDFKQVNDSLGHRAGDELLVEVAKRLATCIREGDTAARLGGDEFAVLLDDTDDDTARQVVRRIQSSLTPPVLVAGRHVQVSASIGTAVGTGATSADELLDRADMAMYENKRRRRRPASGGGDPGAAVPVTHPRASAFDTELAGALERGELRLHYQPLLELSSGRVVAFEALLRWLRPGQGLVQPAGFLGPAEDLGLLVQMGAWVLQEACRQLGEWQRSMPGAKDLRVGVNLSARQLARGDLERSVVDAVAAAGVAPGDLTLEFDDAALLTDGPMTALDNLHRLRALGTQLSLNDFGVGRSSLRQLRDLPVHQVKVDRSCVAGADGDEGDAAFMAGIIRLSSELGLESVGEGIERPRQLDALRAAGCEQGQGYLFARPLPASTLDGLLASPAALAGVGLRL